MVSKKRSEALRERHFEARRQREYFKNNFENQTLPSYSSFLKKETPLEAQFVAYEVSFQVSYTGNIDSLKSSAQTFIVIGRRGQESQIQNNTMNMILDSKGKVSNNNFARGTLGAVKNSTDIQIKPRGLEESSKKITFSDIKKAQENNFHVKHLDDTLKFKNKKGREGEMKLDIRHFM